MRQSSGSVAAENLFGDLPTGEEEICSWRDRDSDAFAFTLYLVLIAELDMESADII